ncbi:hypothetical protein [Agrococcus casei]|uniref:Uncharacterized protein n=1 Tax=Agrococcus casei LMG 22410 TaxID=1255656 RepID=A0A1R4FG19_9MICO|nr:hypothetical protein [Agrococcus casei]SJM54895.1 hypothetical protein CZ674_04370 [Agrococcus casei LMG 22410]
MPEKFTNYRDNPAWIEARADYLNMGRTAEQRMGAFERMLRIESDHMGRQARPHHKARAEALLATIRAGGKTSEQKTALAAEAQVHATLALAEAVNRRG